MTKIEIKADDKEQVICVKSIEDEGKYFCLLEITKEKYEEIKGKIDNIKVDKNTIVRNKRYAKPQIIHCGSCPHCISFITYGDIENYYCLVDDEYKFNDYPKEKDCPFVEVK